MTATGRKTALAEAPREAAGAGTATLRGNPAQRAGYIEELVAELEKLAAGPDLERLRDLLRLAKCEARRVLIEQAH